ncbi:MAG: hypothetical protein ACHQ53_05100 [Polyangiales bacterium]
MNDRRMRRSEHFNTALRFQLESTMQRGRMAALALTDRTGLLLAWAGEDGLCQELGAVAPIVVHGWPPDLERGALPKDNVSVRAIECFGEHLYLASLGGGVARDALLAHSARGIHRILTAN